MDLPGGVRDVRFVRDYTLGRATRESDGVFVIHYWGYFSVTNVQEASAKPG